MFRRQPNVIVTTLARKIVKARLDIRARSLLKLSKTWRENDK